VKYLVLSDLHSNLEALRAVLEHAAPAGCERSLVLGDIVGYGADPLEVIEVVRALPGLAAVRGNHDRVAAGFDDGNDFNPPARTAAHWTRARLTGETAGFLRGLARGPLECAPGVLLSHGSPLDEDEYLLDAAGARRCLRDRAFALCFFGHTHLPCVFVEDGGEVGLRVPRRPEEVVPLEPGRRYLVNPGSVGQPRDRVPLAGYAIYDPAAATVTFRRVPYAIAETRRKILDAGLPSWLGDRLVLGV
jgi:diadenosine tetraphosphatase ApaH/serine/threonine PP2A family protein phosphatase